MLRRSCIVMVPVHDELDDGDVLGVLEVVMVLMRQVQRECGREDPRIRERSRRQQGPVLRRDASHTCSLAQWGGYR